MAPRDASTRPVRTAAPSPRPAGGPLYLDAGRGPIFSWFHAPAGAATLPTGVLICPPWGWSDVASYRSRRAWADELAGAGRPVLRFDLPGTGDSAGSDSDRDLARAWVEAVTASATWLREAGCERVAVLGLGLGGLLAAVAAAEGGSIDDLILWSAPVRGRSFVRQERAFAGLQTSRYSLTGEPEPSLLPDGWLEVGGFVLSAETIAGVESMDPTRTPFEGLQRALLLDHDGIPISPDLASRLRSDGVAVTMGPGPGYEEMCFHPERFAPPLEVMATVARWLADGDQVQPRARLSPPPPVRRPSRTETAALRAGGAAIRESSFVVDRPFGRLFGILAEPDDGQRAGLTAVFLNAGAVRRIGPNRLFVDSARAWAARGVPTLRIDLEGIGDSSGDPAPYRDVGQFYRAALEPEIAAFLDALVARGHPGRFVLAGLCAGGYWAFNAAADDSRVAAALMLNPGALVWDPELGLRRDADKVRRLANPTWWRRLVRGQVRRARIRAVARAVVRRWAGIVAGRGRRSVDSALGGRDRIAPIERVLDRLSAHGTRVFLAFSADEPLHGELGRSGLLDRLSAWPNVELGQLPARDHTLRPIIAQRAALEALDREMTRALWAEAHAAPIASVTVSG